jgi:hypothetical protein
MFGGVLEERFRSALHQDSGNSFVEVLEYLFVEFRPDEVDMYAEGARQLWFKRNKVVHGGDFAHPNDLIILIAKNHIADYKAAMQPVTLVHDAEVTSDGAEEILLKVTST